MPTWIRTSQQHRSLTIHLIANRASDLQLYASINCTANTNASNCWLANIIRTYLWTSTSRRGRDMRGAVGAAFLYVADW